MDLVAMCNAAKSASRALALTPGSQRDQFLTCLAQLLLESQAETLAANQTDLDAGRESGLSEALLDRLMLNEKRLAAVCEDLNSVADLPDPVGEVFDSVVVAARAALLALGERVDRTPLVQVRMDDLDQRASSGRGRFDFLQWHVSSPPRS